MSSVLAAIFLCSVVQHQALTPKIDWSQSYEKWKTTPVWFFQLRSKKLGETVGKLGEKTWKATSRSAPSNQDLAEYIGLRALMFELNYVPQSMDPDVYRMFGNQDKATWSLQSRKLWAEAYYTGKVEDGPRVKAEVEFLKQHNVDTSALDAAMIGRKDLRDKTARKYILELCQFAETHPTDIVAAKRAAEILGICLGGANESLWDLYDPVMKLEPQAVKNQNKLVGDHLSSLAGFRWLRDFRKKKGR